MVLDRRYEMGKWKDLILIVGLTSSILLMGCTTQTSGEIRETKTPESNNVVSDVRSTNDSGFELSLYKELDESGKNLIFSPYSLADAISLLYNAADGETKKQMEDIIGLSEEQFNFYRQYDKAKHNGVSVANKAFYTDRDIELNLDVLGTDEIQQVNMETEAVKVINDYIAENTHNKIQRLIGDGQLDEAVLVLVNALYFNKMFNFEEKTLMWEDGQSYNAFGEDVELTNIKEVGDDIDVLKLDYLEDKENISDYSLYIICDSETSTENRANNYVKGLTSDEFRDILDFSDYAGLKGYDKANFVVPDYEMEYKESLSESLKHLGFTEAFSDVTTDFNKLGPVYINDIIQGAYIKTNKSGTEAAAATALISFEATSMEPDKPTRIKHVRADSEFVYVIKDNKADTILFMGKVAEPSAFNNGDEGDSDTTDMEKKDMTELDMYKALRKDYKGENFVFSPYSIKDCFSIIEPAVTGKMKEQMDMVLGYNRVSADDYIDYDAYTNNNSGYSGLKVANRAFVNIGDEVNEDALSNSDIERIEMLPDGYAHINQYVSENTNNRINDLLKPTDIDKDTSLVLVNALHFLKSWEFDKGQINFGKDEKLYKGFKDDEFWVGNIKEREDIDVVKLRYTKTPEEMAYSGILHEYSMYLICDSDNSEEYKVESFVDSLSYDELRDLLDFENYEGLSDYDSATFIAPNFEAEYKKSIIKTLVELGMVEGLANETADMSMISNDVTKISDVIHGAYIKTDENGTEAAASTAVSIMKNMAMAIEDQGKVKNVVVDSPFMFIVKDDTSNMILFMGYIEEPSDEI